LENSQLITITANVLTYENDKMN